MSGTGSVIGSEDVGADLLSWTIQPLSKPWAKLCGFARIWILMTETDIASETWRFY